MLTMSEGVSFGPLPTSDRNDELEEQSLRALLNAFPTDRFRVRSEPGKDRGADRYLEVKVSGCDTNCRSQLQMKSTGSPSVTLDGSVSLSVQVSNLNYLLNGPSPLYVLWVALDDRLLYAWAHDERRRLDLECPGWMEQDSVTIRFRRDIDPAALDEIHGRILREAQLDRRIQETLARSTESERVTVRIDRTTLQSTDPRAVRQSLMTSGMTIVASRTRPSVGCSGRSSVSSYRKSRASRAGSPPLV